MHDVAGGGAAPHTGAQHSNPNETECQQPAEAAPERGSRVDDVHLILDDASLDLVRRVIQVPMKPLVPVVCTPVFKLISESRDEADDGDDAEEEAVLRRSERVSDFGRRVWTKGRRLRSPSSSDQTGSKSKAFAEPSPRCISQFLGA